MGLGLGLGLGLVQKLLISAHLRCHGTREAGTHTLYVQHRGKRPRATGTYRTR